MKFLIKRPVRHNILIHLTCWLLLIGYEESYAIVMTGHFSVSSFCYFYACNIGLFYCQTYILNKTLGTDPPHYKQAIGLTLLLLLLFLILKFPKDYQELRAGGRHQPSLSDFRYAIWSDLYRNIFYAGLALLIWLKNRAFRLYWQAYRSRLRELRATREREAAETRQAATQYAYLQQQLQPHLLFNALNFIFNAVRRSSPEGAQAVLLLSDMMRFSLEGPDTDGRVALSREVEQLEKLLALNRYRYHYPLTVSLEVTGDIQTYRIIPLILFTLAENLFKHGDLQHQPAELQLAIHAEGRLRFTCRNYKRAPTEGKEAGGRGLDNVRLRLDYAYPSAYELAIRDTPEQYTSTLTMKL
jgi:two-component system LytT family sensor kinase